MNDYPRISIVTPSFNQGRFLEQTILSVIGQHYPNLEYIVLDGASTDNSLEIIKKYERHISFWESKKDDGQAAAINRGFAIASGDILGWLNSDDFYLPGTLLHISGRLDISLPQLLFGDCLVIRENKDNRAYAVLPGYLESREDLLNGSLPQPSVFWTRKTWLQVGPLDRKMQYAFDLEWFNRAKTRDVQFAHVPRHLSVCRFHEKSKTNSGGDGRLHEIAMIYGKYRSKMYENAFKTLIEKRSSLRRVKRLINKVVFFGGSGMKKSILKVVFPVLRQVKNDDYEFFLKRIIGPEN